MNVAQPPAPGIQWISVLVTFFSGPESTGPAVPGENENAFSPLPDLHDDDENEFTDFDISNIKKKGSA